MTQAELQRQRRLRRYEDGDCVACGIEPRGEGVLGPLCREKNNARRRKGGPSAGRRGHPPDFIRSVAQAVGSGESRRSVARRLGMSTATIWRWIHKEAA